METFSALLAICAGNSPGEFPHNGQWREALMFSLMCVWVNNLEAGDLRRYRVHCDVIVMTFNGPEIGVSVRSTIIPLLVCVSFLLDFISWNRWLVQYEIWRPIYQHGLTFKNRHGWIITCPVKCSMTLLIHSQTSTVAYAHVVVCHIFGATPLSLPFQCQKLGNIYRSNVQVTFRLYGPFRCLFSLLCLFKLFHSN